MTNKSSELQLFFWKKLSKNVERATPTASTREMQPTDTHTHTHIQHSNTHTHTFSTQTHTHTFSTPFEKAKRVEITK